MSFVEILAVVGIVIFILLGIGTLLGFIDWRDPKGLK